MGDPTMRNVAFLLMPGFSAMAFFSGLEPLRIANRLLGREAFRWTIHAPKGDHALASNGIQILAPGPIAQGADTLIVCAGFDPLVHNTAALAAVIRRMWRTGARVVAIDTGAFLLAEAGILGREPITLHWEAKPEFQLRYPQIPVSSELFESHAQLSTCAGGTAAMDMMLDWIGREHGEVLANAVSEQLIHERIRKSTDHQRTALTYRIGSRRRLVLGAVEIMEAHTQNPLSIEAIADRMATTRRNLERHFLAGLGEAPASYYRRIRLELAANLCADTNLTLASVAEQAGFTSASVLSRAFKAHFGHAPRQSAACGRDYQHRQLS